MTVAEEDTEILSLEEEEEKIKKIKKTSQESTKHSKGFQIRLPHKIRNILPPLSFIGIIFTLSIVLANFVVPSTFFVTFWSIIVGIFIFILSCIALVLSEE